MEEMKTVINPKKEDLKVGNVTFRSFYDYHLTEKDLMKARLELGETDEKKKDLLLELKEKLIEDQDFHYRLDDEYLLRYLRYRKYNVKKAYNTLRGFYELRKERPDIFDIPHNIEDFLKRDIMKGVPYKTEDGCFIYWLDTYNWNVDEMSYKDILRTEHVCADVLSMNPTMQINGVIGLCDFGGLTTRHAAHVASVSILRLFAKSLQSIYPCRIKLMVIVNCNAFLRGLYRAFCFLLTKKIADRVVLLGSDVKEIHKYLNPQLLPKVYGGCIETSDCSIAQYIQDNLPYIKYERSFGPNVKV